jgi:hypothetical protein
MTRQCNGGDQFRCHASLSTNPRCACKGAALVVVAVAVGPGSKSAISGSPPRRADFRPSLRPSQKGQKFPATPAHDAKRVTGVVFPEAPQYSQGILDTNEL